MPEDNSRRGSGGVAGPSYPGSWGWNDPYWGGCFYWDGYYHYWDGTCYYPGWGRYGHYTTVRIYDREADYHARRGDDDDLLVFFPPEIPPLGASLPRSPEKKQRMSAPDALGDYVGEAFYAPLSTRLVRKNLSARQLQQLEDYRTARSALLEELLAKISSVQGLDLQSRTQELETFSHQQAARIEGLEKTAESLRTGLLRSGLAGALSGSGDWNQNRKWRLGKGGIDQARDKTLAMEFRVVRAAIYYQDGLTPGQRRLLAELAMELQVKAYLPQTAQASRENEPMFFSPDIARIQFSDDLPDEVVGKLNLYKQQKDELKEQLRDILYAKDAAGEKERTRALQRLAEMQAPKITALENLAEMIRWDIAVWNRPVRRLPLPDLPEDLLSRVAAYREEKAVLQRAFEAKVRTLEQTSSKVDAADFKRTYGARFIALEEARKSLCAEFITFFSKNGWDIAGKSVDTFMKIYEQAKSSDRAWLLYEDYQNAMLRPGLSPAQRRLLFDAAVGKLKLPLPDGEYLP